MCGKVYKGVEELMDNYGRVKVKRLESTTDNADASSLKGQSVLN